MWGHLRDFPFHQFIKQYVILCEVLVQFSFETQTNIAYRCRYD